MLWALFWLQSGWTGQEVCSPFLLCDVPGFSQHGQRFTLYAFHHSCGLKRTHRPCFRSLLLPDQYHCVTAKSKHTVQCPNLLSVMRPVPHSVELPVPKPPTSMMLSDSKSSDEDVGQSNNNMDCDPTFAGACSSNEPHLLTQGGLNDIVRDLNLSKRQAELLGSRLKGWYPLHQETKV